MDSAFECLTDLASKKLCISSEESSGVPKKKAATSCGVHGSAQTTRVSRQQQSPMHQRDSRREQCTEEAHGIASRSLLTQRAPSLMETLWIDVCRAKFPMEKLQRLHWQRKSLLCNSTGGRQPCRGLLTLCEGLRWASVPS